MQQDFFNPQDLQPEQFGGPDGYRLLTQEEAAVLMDPESAKTYLAQTLRETLNPEFYHEGICRWTRATRNERLTESFTYRTANPHPYEKPEAPAFQSPQIPGILLSDAEFRQDTAEGINGTVAVCHGLAVAAGWHSDLATGKPVPVNVAEKLLLIHSEISEACEGYRKNLPDDKLPTRPMPEVELADAVIRIFDLAGALDLDLGGAIVEKLMFNQKRADHSLESRRQANGKKF